MQLASVVVSLLLTSAMINTPPSATELYSPSIFNAPRNVVLGAPKKKKKKKKKKKNNNNNNNTDRREQNKQN